MDFEFETKRTGLANAFAAAGAELATAGEKTADDVEAEFADLLPGSYYMDPPDGGSPSVLEQVSRMAEDAAQWRAHLARQPKAEQPESWRKAMRDLVRVLRGVECGDDGQWKFIAKVCSNAEELLAAPAPAGAHYSHREVLALCDHLIHTDGRQARDLACDLRQKVEQAMLSAGAQNAEAIRNQALSEAAEICEANICDCCYTAEHCAEDIRALQTGSANTQEGGAS